MAEKLLNSIADLSEEDKARLWAEEAHRRHGDRLLGVTPGRSETDVLRDIRARLDE